MSTTQTFLGTLVAGAVIAGATAAWAQPAGAAPSREDPVRPQVQTFEMVLGRAIEVAGRNFAARANQIAPDMMPVAFPTGEAPNVSGVVVRDLGLYVFHVQVPSIGLTLQVMNLMANRQPFGVAPQGPRQVNERVGSTGVVTPDPVSAPPGGPTKLDFEVEYRLAVREALIEAVVDNAASLPMGASESLLVVASGIDPSVPNPFYRNPPGQKLVLRVKASDLAAFREGRIARDEVKQRVLASSF